MVLYLAIKSDGDEKFYAPSVEKNETQSRTISILIMFSLSGLMACSSTFPCPLCLARQGILDQVGDPRTWAQIIAFCEAWLIEGGDDPDRRKEFGCCHNMPIIGPATPTPVSSKIVPPPLHLELSMNKPLKKLSKMWGELHLWLKSINVEEFPYHGGNELGKTSYSLLFICLWLRKELKVSQCPCVWHKVFNHQSFKQPVISQAISNQS